MAKDTKVAETQRNAQAAVIGTALNNGYCRLFNGIIPATIAAALSGNTQIAELRFAATAFGPPSAGVITANAMTPEDSAAAGTPTFYRCYQSDGTTVVCQGTVGDAAGDYNLEFPSATIPAGAEVQITSFTHTVN